MAIYAGENVELEVNATLDPGNGIILQVMDSDDPDNPTGYYAEPEASENRFIRK